MQEITREKVLVVGVGEIGRPLLELIGRRHEAYGLDLKPEGPIPKCETLHICFPYNGGGVIQNCLCYIRQFEPSLTIINSTVAPGTTRRIAMESGCAVVNSPVRGKHARMKEEMLRYKKFIGAMDKTSGARAFEHFESIGMHPVLLSSPEASELAKLTETTYFGVLIAWAQEVERYAQKFGVKYDEVVSFYDEIPFLPAVKYFPGEIGGHCVMPNIKILKQQFSSGFLDAIEASNQIKREGLGVEGWELP